VAYLGALHDAPFLPERKIFEQKMAHFEPKIKKNFRGTASCPDPSPMGGDTRSLHATSHGASNFAQNPK